MTKEDKICERNNFSFSLIGFIEIDSKLINYNSIKNFLKAQKNKGKNGNNIN